jgi:D-alanine-D-alanine ligase
VKLSIGVLFGGRAVEHEVSIISALQAIRNFDSEKYAVVPIYISRESRFYVGDALGEISSFRDPDALTGKLQEVVLVRGAAGGAALHAVPFKWRSKPLSVIDLAFPIVHGTSVEDGTLQGFLRTLGLPTAGCGVAASALGMDKFVQKALYRDAGLPVVNALRFTSGEYLRTPDKVVAMLEWQLPYPMVVKPSDLGSSVGVALVKDRRELESAIESAAMFSHSLIAEAAVLNLREINCAVLGDRDGAEASECEEPLGGDILSYDDKYNRRSKSGVKGMASLSRLLPAPLEPELRATIRDFAVKAFLALGCSGVARVDFLLDGQTGDVWVNEINTIPGSLSFYLWQASGLPYPELLDRLVELALKSDRESREVSYSLETNILANYSGGGKSAYAK